MSNGSRHTPPVFWLTVYINWGEWWIGYHRDLSLVSGPAHILHIVPVIGVAWAKRAPREAK